MKTSFKTVSFASLAIIALVSGIYAATHIFLPPTHDHWQKKFPANMQIQSLAEFDSQFLVIDFWASWCVPCADSLPHYKSLFAPFTAEKLQWVAVNQDLDKKNADAFLKRNQLQDIPVFYDSNASLQQAFKVRGLPTLIVFDQNRKEITRVSGYDKSKQQAVEALIMAALAEQP
ncbi:TlpA family protein disulfide reductase [Gayadomonas joobiniege]|uniref:TlpA family protein disulfide reductase n=1 Tax=Gayadomonas joobiniege TaxID=1234606 RepID=UPI000374CF45|nr:TlpA disulfide reductase family protein [Gayadomonas joobiniege]